ncbi:hypothetical protein [Hyphococcus luteus]|uniref:Beta-lactamase-related domain-containing protein n=1 Tax=Hyphococcus luteus TaxID=2058213 RepID=A0A2S7K1K8_9PROT|nr:hypothetical protein [Marinicaulis flavus]PQA86387.1 hypothetical protein CW354_18830 [Marinicaulis flavus]
MTTKSKQPSTRLFMLGAAWLALGGAAFADSTDATNAANGSACNDIRPFYWEIGEDSGGPVVSGQVGGTDYARDTQIGIASASKWIFGAYVLERYYGPPTGSAGATIVSALNMQEGHTSFSPLYCAFTTYVNGCHMIGSNDDVDSSKVGYFNYGGGDGQYAAADTGLLGLNTKTATTLLNEVNSYLSLGSDFEYNFPAVAGGMRSSAEDYAAFLQNLMDGTYVMSSYLGDSAVNTQCTECSSPFGSVDLHYSYFHWVEDQTGGNLPNGTSVSAGDGSFSSPGALGFYPWISADKETYGIVATDDASFQESYVCGVAIRDAYFQ